MRYYSISIDLLLTHAICEIRKPKSLAKSENGKAVLSHMAIKGEITVLPSSRMTWGATEREITLGGAGSPLLHSNGKLPRSHSLYRREA
jgi:hypothetical protein